MKKMKLLILILIPFVVIGGFYLFQVYSHKDGDYYSVSEFNEKTNLKFYDIYDFDEYINKDHLELLSQKDIKIFCPEGSNLKSLNMYFVETDSTEYTFEIGSKNIEHEDEYEKYSLKNGTLYTHLYPENKILVIYSQKNFSLNIYCKKLAVLDKKELNSKIIKYIEKINELYL